MLKEYYLCKKIDEVIQNKYKQYPSLQFLKNGTITIKAKEDNLTRLRIYNTQEQFLSFCGIELWHNDQMLEDKSLPQYEFTVGKTYDDSPVEFEFGKIAKPYIVYTVDDIDLNFFEIKFSSPISIDKIVIYLRNDGKIHKRSNCIAADITDDIGISSTVFSYQRVLWEYAELISNDLLDNISSIYFTLEQIRTVAFIIISAYNESFYNTKNLLLDLEKSYFCSSAVKRYLNNVILLPRKKQYTMNWGCRYTFNIWSEEEKRNYIKTSLDVIEMLKPISDNIFYAFGTLLGFVREPSGFVPHDADIDIVVVGKRSIYPSYVELSGAIRKILEAHGASIPHASTNDFHVVINKCRRFDIFFRFEEDDGKVFLHRKLKNVYMDIEDCYPNSTIDILGYKCPIPKNPFVFLEKVYGADWRVPMDKNIYKKEHGESFMVSKPEDALLDEMLPVLDLVNSLFCTQNMPISSCGRKTSADST